MPTGLFVLPAPTSCSVTLRERPCLTLVTESGGVLTRPAGRGLGGWVRCWEHGQGVSEGGGSVTRSATRTACARTECELRRLLPSQGLERGRVRLSLNPRGTEGSAGPLLRGRRAGGLPHSTGVSQRGDRCWAAPFCPQPVPTGPAGSWAGQPWPHREVPRGIPLRGPHQRTQTGSTCVCQDTDGASQVTAENEVLFLTVLMGTSGQKLFSHVAALIKNKTKQKEP